MPLRTGSRPGRSRVRGNVAQGVLPAHGYHAGRHLLRQHILHKHDEVTIIMAEVLKLGEDCRCIIC